MAKLAVIGGFLGSGKTSIMLRLAQKYASMGIKVGVVSNDKGSQLVDGAFLKASGLASYDVGGGCFCTNFQQFTEVIGTIEKKLRPDIILAEPVGSYMDILSVLFRPVEQKYGAEMELCPLLVTVDPARLMRFGDRRERGTFTPLDRLFQSQLLDADLVLINKADTMTPQQLQRCADLAAEMNQTAQVMIASAQQDTGLEDLPKILLGGHWAAGEKNTAHDESYGIADESMAWLNASYHFLDVASARSIMREALLTTRDRLQGCEIGHIKMLALGEGVLLKVGLTAFDETPGFSSGADLTGEIRLLVNARVETQPKRLEHILHSSLISASRTQKAVARLLSRKCFSSVRS